MTRAAYIFTLKERGRDDPTTWNRGNYILDSQHEGEKVERWRITNCVAGDPGWAVKECAGLASQNTRSTKDRSYHLVISFPEGERPTQAQMDDIEDRIVAAIGLQDHKRVSATHVNTSNYHCHVVICTVNPKTFRNVTPWRDQARMQEVLSVLEREHGLTIENQTAPDQRRAFREWVRANAQQPLSQAANAARTWDDLHETAARYGLVIKPRGAGLALVHHKDPKLHLQAGKVDRSMAFKALTDRLGPYQAPSQTTVPDIEFAIDSEPPKGADSRLWQKYRAAQMETLTLRNAAMIKLRARQEDEAQELADWIDQRYDNLARQRLIRADRLRSVRHIAAKKRLDWAELRQKQRQEREDLRTQFKPERYADFCARAAAAGDRQAANTIERMVKRDVNRGLGRS